MPLPKEQLYTKITFLYTKEEYVKAVQKYLFMSKIITPFSIVFMTILLAGSIIYYMTKGSGAFSALFITVSALYSCIFLAMYFFQPGFVFKQTEKFHEQYQLSFYLNAIDFQTPSISSKLEWKMYHKLWENNDFFYLIQNKNIYTVLPKRAFTTSQDIDTFRDMAREAKPPMQYKRFDI